MAALQARALPLLGEGLYAAHVARILREDERFLQKKAQAWVEQGLLVELGPKDYARFGPTKRYSLSDLGLVLVRQHSQTKQHRLTQRLQTTATNKDARSSPPRVKDSDPVPGREPGAQRPRGKHAHSHGRSPPEAEGWAYGGPHYLWFKARVAAVEGSDVDPSRLPLRRLKKDGTEAMPGQRYLGGWLNVPRVGEVLFERFIPLRREALGAGWLHARFDLEALPGEDAQECARRAVKAGHRVLEWAARRYGLLLGAISHVGNPASISGGHHTIPDHPIARLIAPLYGRRKVKTKRGEMWVDRSERKGIAHPQGEMEGDHERDMDDLMLVGQHAADAKKGVDALRTDQQALWETQERQAKRQEAVERALEGVREALDRLPGELGAAVGKAAGDAVAEKILGSPKEPPQEAPPDPPKSDPGEMFQ